MESGNLNNKHLTVSIEFLRVNDFAGVAMPSYQPPLERLVRQRFTDFSLGL